MGTLGEGYGSLIRPYRHHGLMSLVLLSPDFPKEITVKRETPVNANPLCTPRKSHPWRKQASCDSNRSVQSFAVQQRSNKEKRK